MGELERHQGSVTRQAPDAVSSPARLGAQARPVSKERSATRAFARKGHLLLFPPWPRLPRPLKGRAVLRAERGQQPQPAAWAGPRAGQPLEPAGRLPCAWPLPLASLTRAGGTQLGPPGSPVQALRARRVRAAGNPARPRLRLLPPRCPEHCPALQGPRQTGPRSPDEPAGLLSTCAGRCERGPWCVDCVCEKLGCGVGVCVYESV